MFSGQLDGKKNEKGTEKSRIACETWKRVQGFDKICWCITMWSLLVGSQIHFQVFNVTYSYETSWRNLSCFSGLFLGPKFLSFKSIWRQKLHL